MPVEVKICGLAEMPAVEAAVAFGARLVGFVFFAGSPRHIAPDEAARLAEAVPAGVLRVGLVVDADDEMLADLLSRVPLDLLQLHGAETPERVAQVRQSFAVPVIKAVAVECEADVDAAADYALVADRLLFDARPPAGAGRPGGNARPFDWRLLAGRRWQRPWLLAGGLDIDNLAEAVRASGASAVDVSSGVEIAPGRKSIPRIRAFLEAAAQLGPTVPA
jgi:phosphoribosylanthranilate isomerase